MKENVNFKELKNFIFDVDGVFTDGCFYYSTEGKMLKMFGDADNDALSILKQYLHVEMVTGDKRGYDISAKRINEDMGYPISLVSTYNRLKWLSDRFNLNETVYMGDGIYDPLVFAGVGYSIAPSNAFISTKKYADHITTSSGGRGAVAEAVIHIIELITEEEFDIFSVDLNNGSGNWS